MSMEMRYTAVTMCAVVCVMNIEPHYHPTVNVNLALKADQSTYLDLVPLPNITKYDVK